MRLAVLVAAMMLTVPAGAAPGSVGPPYRDAGSEVANECGTGWGPPREVAVCTPEASADAASGRLRVGTTNVTIWAGSILGTIDCADIVALSAAAWVADELVVTGTVQVRAHISVERAHAEPPQPINRSQLEVSLRARRYASTSRALAPFSSGTVVLTTPAFRVDDRDGPVRVPVDVTLLAVSDSVCRTQQHVLDGDVTVTRIEAVAAS